MCDFSLRVPRIFVQDCRLQWNFLCCYHFGTAHCCNVFVVLHVTKHVTVLKGMSNKICKRRIISLLDISVLTNIIKVLF